MTIEEYNAQISPQIRHLNEKKINRLIRDGQIGYYLRPAPYRAVGQYGDYTDGQNHYHLVKDGKCVLTDCAIKF